MESANIIQNQSSLDSNFLKIKDNEFYFQSIRSLNRGNDKLLELYSNLHSNINSNNEIIYWKDKKQSLEKLLIDCNSIQLFPKEFLNISYFKEYISCHLLIHEKGSSNCYCFNSSRQGRDSRTFFNIGEFNKFFNIVKKSKNKSFNRDQIYNLDIDFLGTFLAKEYAFAHYNIILVLSRNDFLAPSKSELSNFHSFTKNLPPIINGLLENESANKKIINLIQCLYEYPYPLVIKKNDDIIFKNYSYKEVPTYEQLLELESFEIYTHYKLILYTLRDNESHTSDLFHFQRVSLLGELLNTLRHELSNPLFGVALASQILASESKNDDDKEIFREVSKNIERCQLIIENFSNLYQNVNIQKEVNLKKLIEESLTLTKSETRSIEKNIYYQKEIEKHLEIKVNPTWVVQILFNLIVNSAQALRSIEDDNKKLQILISIYKKENFIVVSVSDNGPGINQEQINELFKPFYTTKSNGTGLGLPISKNLARRMDGDILVRSNKPNPGVTFSLFLPIKNNEDFNN